MADSWNGVDTEGNIQLLEETSSVHVYVGPEARCWVLQMNLLCHVSTFFRAALSKDFKEGQEKCVTLKEGNPAVFQIFAVWLYTGELQRLITWDHLLAQAWIFGDKLGAPAFQDCVMIKFITCPSGSTNLPHIIEDVYSNTTKGSLLRTAVIDFTAFYNRDFLEAEAEWRALFARGGDFKFDLIKKFARLDDPSDPALALDKYLLKSMAHLSMAHLSLHDSPQASNTLMKDSAGSPT